MLQCKDEVKVNKRYTIRKMNDFGISGDEGKQIAEVIVSRRLIPCSRAIPFSKQGYWLDKGGRAHLRLTNHGNVKLLSYNRAKNLMLFALSTNSMDAAEVQRCARGHMGDVGIDGQTRRCVRLSYTYVPHYAPRSCRFLNGSPVLAVTEKCLYQLDCCASFTYLSGML